LSGSAHIELVGVEVAHETQPTSAVLHSVQWTINPGERWTVSGKRGSGKTSLLYTGAGLIAPAAGTLRTFGQTYWQSSAAERLKLGRRIGFVFDEGGRLFAHMSILENLVLPLQYHNECDRYTAQQRALELLAWVELEATANLAPARLSPALRRRVALARALTQPVEVLFLDAPLVGLPPEDVQWWLELLSGLSSRKETDGGPVSIVTSCFNLSAWRDWADHCAVLHDGYFQPVSDSEAPVMSEPRPDSKA